MNQHLLVVEGTQSQFKQLMEAYDINEDDVEASQLENSEVIRYWVLIRSQSTTVEVMSDVNQYIEVIGRY
ncbi:hypothetical protein [Oceanobacillus luteolus]|uniref:Uncharacterized protein n=1 Tax=Oceanobacillus luteolus TaxID=1274358 RepID=A0ABW4HY21_9BACI